MASCFLLTFILPFLRVMRCANSGAPMNRTHASLQPHVLHRACPDISAAASAGRKPGSPPCAALPRRACVPLSPQAAKAHRSCGVASQRWGTAQDGVSSVGASSAAGSCPRMGNFREALELNARIVSSVAQEHKMARSSFRLSTPVADRLGVLGYPPPHATCHAPALAVLRIQCARLTRAEIALYSYRTV
jgi:hypothetical protein